MKKILSVTHRQKDLILVLLVVFGLLMSLPRLLGYSIILGIDLGEWIAK